MNKVKFYMAGGMAGLTIEQQIEWRNDIMQQTEDYSNYINPTYFFQPPYYYQFNDGSYKSEKEVMEFDLNRLRKSDVVIVNFNVPNSIGTAMELAIAHENKIPIIGLNEDKNDIHPWLKECCTRICETREELVKHICEFYLT